MRCKLFLCTFLLCNCLSTLLTAQIRIKGQVKDKETEEAVPYVSIQLYSYKSEQVKSYTLTNDSGYYDLQIPQPRGVFTLKTRRMGYKDYVRDIVIAGDEKEVIDLSFSLIPDVEELEEIEIKRPPAIILKDDTIIYDIENWTEARDQTLEQVLAKIPGFRIMGDGEIMVNGKMVNKVVIDGEELSNSGAALITRSLSPQDVKQVELRTDEKDRKLKESLLDADPYVVLDIKLKDELKKSLFGKVHLNGGYQDRFVPGAYTNLFSIKKRTRGHFFAESDRFGNEAISLDMIKYIGAEAQAQWFHETADFNEFLEAPAVQEELYGFNDYVLKENDIAGFTTRLILRPEWDLYLGTYNARTALGTEREFIQQFKGMQQNRFMQSNNSLDYTSKNKMDLRYNKGKIKSTLNLNAVLGANEFNSLQDDVSNALEYRFSNSSSQVNFYKNFLFEYAPSDKLGIQVKTSYTQESHVSTRLLQHNDSIYGTYLLDAQNNQVFDMHQIISHDPRQLIADAYGQYRYNRNTIHIGFKHRMQEAAVEKRALNLQESESQIPLFSAPLTQLSYKQSTPYLHHGYYFGIFRLENNIGYNMIQYPASIDEVNSFTRLLTYKSRFSFDAGHYNNFSISWEQRITSFPMLKIFEGNTLQDFQTIQLPGLHNFQPMVEQVGNLLFGVNFSSIKLRIDPYCYVGFIQNNDRFLFQESPFIEIAYDQLPSRYINSGFYIIKEFKKLPLNLTLEPEWLIGYNDNLDGNDELYSTRTSIPSIGLKARSSFESSFFNFTLFPKYTSFRFGNQFVGDTPSQEMLSFELVNKFDLFNDRFLISTFTRAVQFWGAAESEFLNVGFKLEYPVKQFRFSLIADNIFNNRSFIRQRILPTFFIDERSAVFGRFVQFSVQYKIN